MNGSVLGLLLALSEPAPVATPVPEPASDPAPSPASTATPEPDPSAVPAPTTFADDPLGVRQLVLANGLTVLLSENHERPEVFGGVVVRTGGKNDPADNTGMAHYLEHMLFKGTTELGTTNWDAERPLQEKLESLYEQLRGAKATERKRIQAEIAATVAKTYAYAVPNEIDQLLEDIGSTGVNAFTTYDETVYHNTFPASQIGAWLEIYAKRFEQPVFRLFPTELEAVYEEKNIAIDTTGYELFRTFMRGAFPGHPYGNNDILGEVDHLKRPSLAAMKRYYDRWYVPSNMALVLSGDFSTDAILPLIERQFGAWKEGPAPRSTLPALAPFERDQRLSARTTPVRAGAIAFRTLTESHPDFAALQLARRLLSNEQRSGLIDRLSDEGKMLYAVHVPADLADHNLDVVAYVPRLLTQSFGGAERLVLAQFKRIRDGAFDDSQFVALREALIVEQTRRWEDNRERALAMGHAFVAAGGWQGYLDYLSRLRGLSRDDVVRVAKGLFADRRLTLRSRVGYPKKARLDKPRYPPVRARPGAHSRLFKALRDAPKSAGEPRLVDIGRDVVRGEVRPGTSLVTSANPFDDLYQLELRFSVGTDRIRELDLLEDWIARTGSAKHTAAQMRAAFFGLSTTVSAEAEVDRFVVRLEGPQKHMQAALALLDELIRAPSRDRRALRQIRREIWAFRRLARKNPPDVAAALRDHALYGVNSPFHREIGPRGARLVGPRKLLAAWARVQEHPLEVGYVGRMEPSNVAELVRTQLELPTPTGPAAPRVVYPRNVPDETTVYFVPHRDAVQTQVWLAVEGDPVAPPSRSKAEAFSAYFGGGMAGLVFQEVREFRALAYAARGAYDIDDEPQGRSHLLAHVGCQADKTFEVLEVMRALITEMPQRPDRIELVRSSLLRSQETATPSFRELQDRIDEWKRQGFAEDPRKVAREAYAKLTFEDVLAFYRSNVADRPLSIMVVGNPRKVKLSQLRRYGRVVRLPKWRLYSR